MRGETMRSNILGLILTAGAAITPTMTAAQDLQKLEGSGDAAGIQDKGRDLPGNDWSAVTVELEPGAVRSWLSPSDDELLYVLEGSGRLEMGRKSPITLNPGIVAKLGSAPRHVVKNTSSARSLRMLVVFRTENGQGHPLLAARQVQPPKQSSMTAKESSRQLNAEKRLEPRQPARAEEIGLMF
jgi:quercetin dioxygenase-like cupin family protein